MALSKTDYDEFLGQLAIELGVEQENLLAEISSIGEAALVDESS